MAAMASAPVLPWPVPTIDSIDHDGMKMTRQHVPAAFALAWSRLKLRGATMMTRELILCWDIPRRDRPA